MDSWPLLLTSLTIEILHVLKLMRRDLVSQVKCIQMGPNSHLSTCVDEKIVPSKEVTGVVPTTTSPMPKSEQKEYAFSKK